MVFIVGKKRRHLFDVLVVGMLAQEHRFWDVRNFNIEVGNVRSILIRRTVLGLKSKVFVFFPILYLFP
jgi:hypothetical protein